MVRHTRPYRQGDLDELCGVYAVVNALQHVLHLRNEQCRELFGQLISTLEQDGHRWPDRLVRGMYFNQLKRLALAAGQGHFGEQNLAFQVRPLRLKQDQRTLPHLWAKLNQELGPTCVAIIGISGALHHWCVAYRVTPKTLWLLDSAGRRRISRSRCTVQFSQTRYCLEVNEILLIKR